MKIVRVDDMRRIERATDASGWSYAAMMERAGQAVVAVLQERVQDLAHRRTLILAGPGNNGGDGFVVARLLHDQGCPVTLYCWKTPEPGKSSPEACQNFDLVRQRGIVTIVAGDDTDQQQLRRQVAESDLLVDALLGTGASRPISGQLQRILTVVRQELEARAASPTSPIVAPASPPASSISLRPLVLAVDCPSGLDCDNGAIDPLALDADVTVTFACPKLGQLLFPGAAACGELLVADIGTNPALASHIALELATPDLIGRLLPRRPPNAHKGTFGRALLVVGSANYTGAAYLAGAAALRVGTGLVTLAVGESLHPVLAAGLHEPTWLLLPENTGVIAPDAAKLLRQHAADCQAMLLGCGLTKERPAAELVQVLLEAKPAASARIGFVRAGADAANRLELLPPLVLDADALNILADIPDWPLRVPPGSVLTPHPGEMARLCGCSVSDVNDSRWDLAQTKAAEWGQVVLLKGAFTIVAAPDGRTVLLPFANAGLATGGSGDVLAGAVVGLLAQGLSPFEAAVAGGYVHGLAGAMTAKDLGHAGMVAGDLLSRLPLAIEAVTPGHVARGGRPA